MNRTVGRLGEDAEEARAQLAPERVGHLLECERLGSELAAERRTAAEGSGAEAGEEAASFATQLRSRVREAQHPPSVAEETSASSMDGGGEPSACAAGAQRGGADAAAEGGRCFVAAALPTDPKHGISGARGVDAAAEGGRCLVSAALPTDPKHGIPGAPGAALADNQARRLAELQLDSGNQQRKLDRASAAGAQRGGADAAADGGRCFVSAALPADSKHGIPGAPGAELADNQTQRTAELQSDLGNQQRKLGREKQKVAMDLEPREADLLQRDADPAQRGADLDTLHSICHDFAVHPPLGGGKDGCWLDSEDLLTDAGLDTLLSICHNFAAYHPLGGARESWPNGEDLLTAATGLSAIRAPSEACFLALPADDTWALDKILESFKCKFGARFSASGHEEAAKILRRARGPARLLLHKVKLHSWACFRALPAEDKWALDEIRCKFGARFNASEYEEAAKILRRVRGLARLLLHNVKLHSSLPRLQLEAAALVAEGAQRLGADEDEAPAPVAKARGGRSVRRRRRSPLPWRRNSRPARPRVTTASRRCRSRTSCSVCGGGGCGSSKIRKEPKLPGRRGRRGRHRGGGTGTAGQKAKNHLEVDDEDDSDDEGEERQGCEETTKALEAKLEDGWTRSSYGTQEVSKPHLVLRLRGGGCGASKAGRSRSYQGGEGGEGGAAGAAPGPRDAYDRLKRFTDDAADRVANRDGFVYRRGFGVHILFKRSEMSPYFDEIRGEMRLNGPGAALLPYKVTCESDDGHIWESLVKSLKFNGVDFEHMYKILPPDRGEVMDTWNYTFAQSIVLSHTLLLVPVMQHYGPLMPKLDLKGPAGKLEVPQPLLAVGLIGDCVKGPVFEEIKRKADDRDATAMKQRDTLLDPKRLQQKLCGLVRALLEESSRHSLRCGLHVDAVLVGTGAFGGSQKALAQPFVDSLNGADMPFHDFLDEVNFFIFPPPPKEDLTLEPLRYNATLNPKRGLGATPEETSSAVRVVVAGFDPISIAPHGVVYRTFSAEGQLCHATDLLGRLTGVAGRFVPVTVPDGRAWESPAAFFARPQVPKFKPEEGYESVRFVPESALEELGYTEGHLVLKERGAARVWNGDSFEGWTLESADGSRACTRSWQDSIAPRE